MDGYLNVISVPAIAFVVYWVIAISKYAVGENEKFKRFIPLIAAVLGVAGGIICFYALPDIIPADNVVVAIVIGGASGLTATATNQMIKQIAKKDEKTDKNDTKNKDDNNDKPDSTAEPSDSADESQTDVQNIDEADGETSDTADDTKSDEKTDFSESDIQKIDDLIEENSDTAEDSTPE